MTPNQTAFLACIGYCEGTDTRPDPYRVCYAFRHTIESFAEHPAISGEWHGEPLDHLGPTYAGKVSTAAGRYQLIKPTWIRARNALHLTDFSPQSQDMAALWLATQDAYQPGVLADLDAGAIGTAVSKCRNIWASFPGANAPGQPQRDMDNVIAAFVRAGGQLMP